MNVLVIGAGSWGTALSMVLADNGHDVRLFGNNELIVREINDLHTNSKYLPNVFLPETIRATNKMDEALEDVDFVLLVVPTKATRDVLRNIRMHLKKPLIFVHASKGIEPVSSKRISELIFEEMPQELISGVVVLSGPSHAEEVILRHPTTVSSASTSVESAKIVQEAFINNYFRVYTNSDVIGVELGGALKNIIALGAGISDGLGYGDNAKAALITRGLTEITRLGVAMGASPLTFGGLTGIGDLIVTCTSVHSRNWRAGNLLGQGQKLDDVLENMGMVVEGVRTTKAAHELSKKLNIEMPITNALYEVLFNNRDPKEAVDSLMNRDRKNELEETAPLFEI